MAALHFIEFDPADNPMQLSKIGNWVITYLSPKEELINIQLAINTVLPRQVSHTLQPLRICISKTDVPHRWSIDSIECYDSATGKDVFFTAEDEMGHTVMESLIREFRKYDVSLQLI